MKTLLACADPPVVLNSKPSAEVTAVSRDGVNLKGSYVEFECLQGFAQNFTKSVCNAEGEWLPKIQCYPGINAKF